MQLQNFYWIWITMEKSFMKCAHDFDTSSGLILGLRPANERRYKVTPSLIGWAQT